MAIFVHTIDSLIIVMVVTSASLLKAEPSILVPKINNVLSLWAEAVAERPNDRSLPSINNSSLDRPPMKISCFQSSTPPFWLPVQMEDYYKDVQQIPVFPQAMTPSSWHLDSDPSHALRWFSGQCAISLGASVRSIYTFPPIYVAHAAALIAHQCLIAEKVFFGGIAELGRVMVAVDSRAKDPGSLAKQ